MSLDWQCRCGKSEDLGVFLVGHLTFGLVGSKIITFYNCHISSCLTVAYTFSILQLPSQLLYSYRLQGFTTSGNSTLPDR